MGYDVFNLPRLHYSEMRRLAEGQALLDERDRDRRIAAAGGDVEKVHRKERAKEHHRQQVSQKRDKLREKWGVA